MHTKNVVDWGVKSRLKKIRAALDAILAKEVKEKQIQIKWPGEPLSPPVS